MSGVDTFHLIIAIVVTISCGIGIQSSLRIESNEYATEEEKKTARIYKHMSFVIGLVEATHACWIVLRLS